MSTSDVGFQAALEEAKKGASEGGVPIGACLVSADGTILGRGHNMRMQKGSPTIHVSFTALNGMQASERRLYFLYKFYKI